MVSLILFVLDSGELLTGRPALHAWSMAVFDEVIIGLNVRVLRGMTAHHLLTVGAIGVRTVSRGIFRAIVPRAHVHEFLNHVRIIENQVKFSYIVPAVRNLVVKMQ